MPFCRILIIRHIGKHWDIVYTENCASRLSQRQHSECSPAYSGCTDLRERRGWKEERTKRQEMENAACLCLCIQLGSPQMHQFHSGERQRSFMWREKRGSVQSSAVFSVCCRFAFMAQWREVSVMYCGFFTPGCLLANDYFIYVAYVL